MNSPKSVIQCFFFQVPVTSLFLKVPSSRWCLLPHLPTPSIYPSITHVCKAVLTDVTNHQSSQPSIILLHVGCALPPGRQVILHFSHNWSTWSPSFSSIKFQNVSGISDLFTTVSRFQHHTKLCSKCSTLLVSSLNLSPICWWISLLFEECCFCHGNPGLNFTYTYCIICYQALQIV